MPKSLCYTRRISAFNTKMGVRSHSRLQGIAFSKNCSKRNLLCLAADGGEGVEGQSVKEEGLVMNLKANRIQGGLTIQVDLSYVSI